MILIVPLDRERIQSYWTDIARLWRQDSIRRRHRDQLHDLRRALVLDQCLVWLAWDDAPRDRGEWGGPHFALGLVVACELNDTLSLQFACGRSLQSWTHAMADAITNYASRRFGQISLYCRKGWKQELGQLWSSYPGTVTFYRDPERLRLDVHQALSA